MGSQAEETAVSAHRSTHDEVVAAHRDGLAPRVDAGGPGLPTSGARLCLGQSEQQLDTTLALCLAEQVVQSETSLEPGHRLVVCQPAHRMGAGLLGGVTGLRYVLVGPCLSHGVEMARQQVRLRGRDPWVYGYERRGD